MRTAITASFLFISVFLSIASSAQTGKADLASPMSLGSTTLNLGAGPGIAYKNRFGDYILGIKTAIEFGLWHAGPGVVTLGGEFGGSNDGLTLVLAGRSAWHYGWHVQGLDVYGGISLGARWFMDDNKAYYDNENKIYPAVGGFIGASYFINNRFGFNAEAGYDLTYLQAGIIFKLR